MAHRPMKPKQQKTFAANAAFLLTAAVLSAPVFAASTRSAHCDYPKEATLEVPASDLVATAVSHDVPVIAAALPAAPGETPADEIESVSRASLLAPRAEAAIRDAFKESDRSPDLQSSDEPKISSAVLQTPVVETKTKSHTTVNSDDRVIPIREMNTKLPGVSDVASSRYKKQMFRRDI